VHLPTAASAETSSELGHCEIIEILVEFSKNLWNFWNSEMTTFEVKFPFNDEIPA